MARHTNSISLPLTISMAGITTIKLFKFIQKILQFTGIFPPSSNLNCGSLNLRNCILSFCLVQFLGSSLVYLVFGANSMHQYGITFFICVTVILFLITHMIALWQRENILNYIENCERFIEKSK